MQKWEYKTLYRVRGMNPADKQGYMSTTTWNVPDMRPVLQSLGAEGWELVAAWSESDFGHISVDLGGVTTTETFIFKRPIE